MAAGKVKFFNTKMGFGFITAEDASEIYFNRASLRRDRAYDPVEGDAVVFEVRDARKGKIAVRIEQSA